MDKWYKKPGNNTDTVISTRIRLARNIDGIPFPSRMDDAQRREVNHRVRDAVFANPVIASDYKYIEMDTLGDAEAMAMAERHIISPEFANNRSGRALILSSDESVSIMLCEEDHIRIQVLRSGFDLEGAYDTADKIDTLIDQSMRYAFDERLGYLTECPSNLGTGLRASVMLHLPALESSGILGRFAAAVSKIGLTIRGTFGEGTRATASMYQLSNQVTLGISEKNAIDNLAAIAKQAMAQEKAARAALDRSALEDTVWRAYGTLKYARSLSTEEFMDLISKVRIGISEGIITGISAESADALIFDCGAAAISAGGNNPNAAERDRIRAKTVRESL